jgi:Predicted integral membrane protein
MKTALKLVVSALAATLALAPMAQAQSAQWGKPQPHHAQPCKDPRKPGCQFQGHKQPPRPPQHAQPAHPKKHHWSKGQRFADWKRRPPVRDYKRHGLRPPAKGQQWVKVDNDYLLIGIATGAIISVINGR